MIGTNRAANPAADSRIQQNGLIVTTKRTRFEVLVFVHTEAILITRSGAGSGHDGPLSIAPLSPRHPVFLNANFDLGINLFVL